MSPGTRRGVDPDRLLDAARGGDRAALARLVSVVERGGDAARQVGRLAFPLAGGAYTVGLTGAPGSGKSTITDRLISELRQREKAEVGVLAIDPSSPFSGGAILGDRVRMQEHALDEGVFIRSMATRGHLGGLSLAVPEAIRLLDAAGLDTILVETVGVGQVEVEVAGAADTTVVAVNPGWGDSVQANKAGLLEVADVLVINKADRPGARSTRRDLQLMLELSAPAHWVPPIIETVATSGEGTAELWAAVAGHRDHQDAEGRLAAKREKRVGEELQRILARRLEERAATLVLTARAESLLDELVARRVDPYDAAERILRELAPS